MVVTVRLVRITIIIIIIIAYKQIELNKKSPTARAHADDRYTQPQPNPCGMRTHVHTLITTQTAALCLSGGGVQVHPLIKLNVSIIATTVLVSLL